MYHFINRLVMGCMGICWVSFWVGIALFFVGFVMLCLAKVLLY